jgi:hypothetical protein
MSGSFARPIPLRAQLVKSLLVTPPTEEQLCDLLSIASIDAGWAAKVPNDELLAEAEDSVGRAYRALVAFRGRAGA